MGVKEWPRSSRSAVRRSASDRMVKEMLAPWGVMLPNFNPFGLDPWPFLEVTRAVEDAGFDAGWVGDHLSFHPPILEATSALAAAAAVTTRLTLGHAVLLAAMREPVWLAKSIATLDHLAPGRVIVGVGAGGEHPPEWEAANQPIKERGRRLDDFLDVLPRLLRGEAVSSGPIQSPQLRPPVSAMPPVVVGGRSEAALRRAARYGDGWMGVWVSPKGFQRSSERLEELAVENGRPAPEPMLLAFVAIGDDERACVTDAADLYRNQYDLDYGTVERWTLTGPAQKIAEQLMDYREAGAQSIALIPCRPGIFEQVERMAQVRALVGTIGG